MIKKIKKQLLFVFCSILIVGCNDDITNQKNDTSNKIVSLTVEKARAWYEASLLDNQGVKMFKANKTDSITLTLKPLLNWDIAQLDNDSMWSVVELPWQYENGKITIANSEVSSYCQSNGTQPEQILRLVILNNRKTGDIYGFKMAVIPDKDYMLSKSNELGATNYYLNRDSKLSGLVLFYTLKDEFVNGWKYIEGNIEGAVNPLTIKSNSKIQRASSLFNFIEIETCYYYTVESGGMIVYHEDCTSSFYFVSSSGSGGSGSNPNGEYDTNYGGGSGSSLNEEGCPGTAFKDACGECVGGNTNKLPCLEDDNSIDPCAEIKKIKADAALSQRLKDYIIKAKNEPIEYGYMKTINGTFLYPIKQTFKSVSYGTYFDKITERVHTHDNIPGGGTYVFSPEDLMVLYSMFINGKMDNPETFRYIVVSAFGIGSLNITDIVAFEQFGKNYDVDKLKNLNEKTTRNGNDINDYLKQFLDILAITNSGLSFSLGEFDMEDTNPEIEWNTKQLDSSGNVTNNNSMSFS